MSTDEFKDGKSNPLFSYIKTEREQQELLKAIEEDITDRFLLVQSETAKRVLTRVVKKVRMVDQSTMMGVDMFEVERMQFED